MQPVRRLSRSWIPAACAVASLLGLPAARAAAQVPPGMLAGLVWRNIGPFRGGRVSAVTGAIGQPGVDYMGLPVGGVWKTTSAGVTWFPGFDGIKTVSSVGAVEVAPSDPEIVYVGTGATNDGRTRLYATFVVSALRAPAVAVLAATAIGGAGDGAVTVSHDHPAIAAAAAIAPHQRV